MLNRALNLSAICLSFVAGLSIGLVGGWGGGYRDYAAHAIAQQVKLIGRCRDGLAITVYTDVGPKDSCLLGSNKLGKVNDD